MKPSPFESMNLKRQNAEKEKRKENANKNIIQIKTTLIITILITIEK